MARPWLFGTDYCNPSVYRDNWDPLGCSGTRLYPMDECHVGSDCTFKLHLYNTDEEPMSIGRVIDNVTVGLYQTSNSRVMQSVTSGEIPLRKEMYDNLDGTLSVTLPPSWMPCTA